MAPETPKGVSSRLLTMKFMQRAAASASSSGSPDADVPSSKKRKLDHSPSQARFSADIDQAMIKAALDDQEAKRLAAIANHTAGDTHWVLNNALNNGKTTKPTTAPLNVVYVGYGDIDSSNESGDNEVLPAKARTSTLSRKSFGKKKSSEQGQAESNSDSSDAEDMDYDHDDSTKRKGRNSSATSDARRTESRSRSRPRQTSENFAAKQLRDKRKKKEVDLNKITSISSGGGKQYGSQDSPNSRPKTCYNCQQAGHFAADCPKRSATGNTLIKINGAKEPGNTPYPMATFPCNRARTFSATCWKFKVAERVDRRLISQWLFTCLYNLVSSLCCDAASHSVYDISAEYFSDTVSKRPIEVKHMLSTSVPFGMA